MNLDLNLKHYEHHRCRALMYLICVIYLLHPGVYAWITTACNSIELVLIRSYNKETTFFTEELYGFE
jgi:hypothetical protein